MERPVSEEHSEVRSGHWDISSLDPKQEVAIFFCLIYLVYVFCAYIINVEIIFDVLASKL